MSCTRTLAGLGNSCKSSLGGIVEAYFTDADNVLSVTLGGTADNPNGKVTGFTMAEGTKLYTYKFDENVSNFQSAFSKNNGIGTYANTINLQFKTLEAAKNVEVSALAEGHTKGIVKTRAGKYFYFGYDGYLTSNDSTTADSGTNYDDFNGYNLVLTSNSAYFPFEIDYSLFSDYLEPAPVEA